MIDLEEKKYLDHVLEKIDIEIAKEEEKLRELHKTGISLSFEDRKRGEHFNINAKASDATERIESLKRSIPTPYFGRIDFSLTDSDNSQKIYIGRKGISSDTESLVTDWRAPISSLYYDSELGDVAYNSPMGVVTGKLNLKRQINIKNSELIDVQDTSLVTNDELLKPYLSTNADNKMKTIIASIQKEQNQIIRKPITDNIIVQGVAGSGKTSVALHRIAYLIYALENKIKSTEFLIIGPNKYFLNYISSILPELETSPVEQKTFLEMLNDILGEKFTVDDTSYVSEEIKAVRNFKSSLRYKNALDKFIKDYLDFNIVGKGIIIDGEEIFSRQEIRNLLGLGDVAVLNTPIDGSLIKDGTIYYEKLEPASNSVMSFQTGDVLPTFAKQAPAGWIMADDGTIGSATSGATHASNDTKALYELLWSYSFTQIYTVTGAVSTKSSRYDLDWNANKRLQVSRMVGRVLGCAGQGAGLTTRYVGDTIGEENHKLTINEMPSHTHNILASNNGWIGTYPNNAWYDGGARSGRISPTGGDAAHNNMQPTFFINYKIKL